MSIKAKAKRINSGYGKLNVEVLLNGDFLVQRPRAIGLKIVAAINNKSRYILTSDLEENLTPFLLDDGRVVDNIKWDSINKTGTAKTVPLLTDDKEEEVTFSKDEIFAPFDMDWFEIVQARPTPLPAPNYANMIDTYDSGL